MRYDPAYLARFYDAYGDAEWNRLEATAYGRLQAIIHTAIAGSNVSTYEGNQTLDSLAGDEAAWRTAAILTRSFGT